MRKTAVAVCILGVLIGVLLWSTPVTRVGSGFLVGDGRIVLTYRELVHEAAHIRVRFPNEDDIAAQRIDIAGPVAILKLQEAPKVKRRPLTIQMQKPDEDYVFTLGYPWTNTQEDRHRLLEGALVTRVENDAGLLRVRLELDPVHSGSPLFNSRREVMGLVLAGQGIEAEPSAGTHGVVPAAVLIDLLSRNGISLTDLPAVKDVSLQEFVEAVRNNVVLIEAQ